MVDLTCHGFPEMYKASHFALLRSPFSPLQITLYSQQQAMYSILLALCLSIAAVPIQAYPAINSLDSRAECQANGNKEACCGGAPECVMVAAGDTCEGAAYCCDTDESVGGLLLMPSRKANCCRLVGWSMSIPSIVPNYFEKGYSVS